MLELFIKKAKLEWQKESFFFSIIRTIENWNPLVAKEQLKSMTENQNWLLKEIIKSINPLNQQLGRFQLTH